MSTNELEKAGQGLDIFRDGVPIGELLEVGFDERGLLHVKIRPPFTVPAAGNGIWTIGSGPAAGAPYIGAVERFRKDDTELELWIRRTWEWD
jgi:hypothetical protein